MARKYKYGHGGETEISFSEQMQEAKKIAGDRWNTFSDEQKKEFTKYKIMKGEIEGETEDYYYAKGGNPKPTIIRTQFEEEEFEYADGGGISVIESGQHSKYEDYEMVVISKEADKDGGRIFKDRFLVSAKDIREAKEIATELWESKLSNSDMSIVKVISEELYRLKYMDKYADGGMMAKGGKTHSRHRKQTLEEKAMESVGSATWFQLDKETQAGVIADMLTIGALPQRMAKGAKVKDVKSGDFIVTYELMDGKKVVEKYDSEELMDEGIANFYIMNDVKDSIVGGAGAIEPEVVKEEVKEVKEEKPKKKGLFDVEKAAPKVSKSKETAPVFHVDGLEKEIQRYDELKAIIKNADSEKEVIGGLIKDVAKDKYLEVYEQLGKRPTSIILESGGAEISYTVLDKYKIVTPEKETVLKEYDNLLGTDYTFTFDNEILDKEGKNGEKIADIINDLIENSEDIPDDLKSKLVKITKKVGVKKGSIERLLAYDSPSEILQVIEPVEMLK